MLAKFSVKKPMTVFVAVILVILLGVVAFTRMTPDLLPNLDFPYVVIVTSYPGASPEQVETEITRPVEQSVATLDNIVDIQSVSSENMSMLILEFSEDANMDATTMNIREQLDQLGASWSDAVGQPYILKINPNMLPVNVSAIACEGYSTAALSTLVEDTLLPQLEGIEGVASVTASGMVEESIQVLFDEQRIDVLNESIRAAIDGQFAEAEDEIATGRQELADAESALSSGQRQLNNGKTQLNTSREEAEQQFAAARTELEQQRASLLAAQTQLRTAVYEIDELLATEDAVVMQLEALLALEDPSPEDLQQIEQLKAALDAIAASKAQRPTLEEQLAETDLGIAALDAALEQLDGEQTDAVAALDAALEELNAGQSRINTARRQMEEAETELDNAQAQLDEAREEAYDAADAHSFVTLSTVAGLLSAQNFSMPAGYAAEEGTQWLVYVGDEIEDTESLEQLVLLDLAIDGLEPIRLCDVADVFVFDNAAETYAKINGEDGVLLAFYKQSNYATATVSANILDRFAELESANDGLRFTPLMDQGSYIRIVVSSVLQNLAVGAVLAVLILLLFLRDLRPTLIVALSIPISVTFAIVLMYFSGVTLNVISMAGLAVGVGMLVDNSIVVIENIYRLRSEGISVYRATISGAAQVAAAIASSTLTTVCVFVPIVFVEGLTRQLFADMALTIAYSLLASLIVALTLVPAVSSGLLRHGASAEGRAQAAMKNAYTRALNFTLRHKAPVLLGSVALLAVSAVLAVSRGFAFMPAMDSNQMSVSVSLDEDATLADTAAVCDEIAARFAELPEVETVGVMQSGGLGAILGMGGASSGDSANSATMYIVLNGEGGRSSGELEPLMESLCADLPCTVDVTGSSMDMSMLTGSGITVRVYGDDLDALLKASREIAERLSDVVGVASVSDGVEETKPELRVVIDRKKAMTEGLTVAQVYQQIAAALNTETTATEVDGLDVVVRSEADDTTVSDVRMLMLAVTGRDGTEYEVALSDIATFSVSETMQSISRSLQRRYVAVSGEVSDGYNVTLVTAEAERALSDYVPPDGVRYEFDGENETILSAMNDLLLMLVLGIVIVYLIMVAQFQSLLSPFIVMMTIPLAFTGGLLALVITGFEVSIVSMIGFVLLVGVIVNNGIVLIDCMNRLRLDGMERREAIVAACSIRLRPVLMTALTTILGLVPLGLGWGMGASLVQPVAVVSIGGLTYATFMTLFVVPVVYDSLCRRPLRQLTKEDLTIVEDTGAV
jgi:multidrug efflux pump subunit AcrB